jgi:hypothetical protein
MKAASEKNVTYLKFYLLIEEFFFYGIFEKPLINYLIYSGVQ